MWSETADVTDERAVAAIVERCVQDIGPPFALFDNAGVQGPFERIDRYSIAEARAVIEVNLVGASRCCRW